MDPLCNACTSVTTGISESILLIDAKLRMAMIVLAIFATVFLATLGIIAFIVNTLYNLFRNWRMMAAKSDPPMTVESTGVFVSMGDDEVYQADVENPASSPPSVADQINKGMASLERTYSEYNKQITDYSQNVLKKPVDDVFDRSVLDRADDDFKS